MKMKFFTFCGLLLILGMVLSGCTQTHSSGQSQVREKPPSAEQQQRQPTYGNPPFVDDWKQRGASGYPADDKAVKQTTQ